jgi:lipid-binding SYLF domain-containing protein
MRVFTTCLLLLGLAVSSRAVDRAGLDAKIRALTVKFEVMQAKPDKRIPAQTLRDAQGIILLDRTKAGFLFAYQGGSGVAMVKKPGSGQWSAPAFLSASEASLGFQGGGQQAFIVILLMNSNAVALLGQPEFKFGGEASGTAGNRNAGTEGAITSDERMELIYADAEGLFGGVAIKGGSLAPDPDANVAYHGQFLTTKEILFDNKAKPSQAAIDLAEQIRKSSR